MKKLLLAAAMVLMAALSAYPFTVDGVNYSIANGVATVTGASSNAATKLTIPATVTYGGTTYPVNFIAGTAFWNCTSLRELVIEDSDTYIGSNSYTDSHGWSQFGDPFKNCPIEKAYVGRNLALRRGTGYQADITAIKSTAASIDLTIAGKTTFIITGLDNGFTFMNQPNITSLTIGGNVENVYKYAFKGCTGLKKVTLLPGETGINFESNTIFTDCPIDSLIMGRDISNTNQCGGAQMKTVIITEELNHLSNNIFWNCTSIKHVVLNDSQETLETSAQYNCMFDLCELESVYIGRYYTVGPMFGRSKIKKVIYGPLVTKVEKNSFTTRDEIEQVIFSDNLTEIEYAAFYDCTSLTEITFPQSLKKIGADAFKGCKSLITADITPNIESIGSGAFRNTALKSVFIPKSVKAIDGDAFGSLKLESFIIEDSENELDLCFEYGGQAVCYKTTIDSVYMGRHTLLANTGSSSLANLFQGNLIKKIEFGPVFNEIPENMCLGYNILENVTFPETCTKIGNDAFRNCTSLTQVKFPESLTTIGDMAFRDCRLAKVDLTPNIETIGSGAFHSAPIKTVFIPKSVVSIDGDAFGSCNLELVIFEDGENSVNLAENYREGVFNDCSIDSVYIGRLVSDPAILFARGQVKKVQFGQAYTEIGEFFNLDANSLEYIDLPESVIKVSNSAFSNCTNIKGIHAHAKIPPLCESNYTFTTEVYDTAVLTVPAGSKKAYRAAEVWKLFKNIQSEGGGFKVAVTYDSTFGAVTLNGSDAAEITVDEDEPLSIAVTPVEGYKVTKVTVNGVDVTASLVDNLLDYESVDSNMEIVVEFGIVTFAVNLPAELTGGRIVVNGLETAPATVDYGSRLEIATVADRGYELAAFSINGADISDSLDENGVYVIENVTADINVEAAFDPIVYTVTAVNLTDFGTLTLNGETGDCKVAFGRPLVIGVMPRDEGCYLVSLTVDGTDVTADVIDGTYTVETVEADMTVEAVFGFYTYTVELGYDPAMGTIIPDLPGGDSDVTVAHGTTLRLTILPAEGYEIATVTLDGDDVTGRVDDNGVLTLENITAAHHVEATFEIKRVRLSVLGLQGGQLAMRYDYGTEVTLLVEPEEGWEFHSLTVGDTTVTSLEPDGSYTTPALTDDTAVSVVFKLAGQSGADLPADAQMITVSTRSTTVIVTGAHDGEQVEVYDTAGVALYRGTDHEIDLNRQGIHIVRVAAQTFKVMLK